MIHASGTRNAWTSHTCSPPTTQMIRPQPRHTVRASSALSLQPEADSDPGAGAADTAAKHARQHPGRAEIQLGDGGV